MTSSWFFLSTLNYDARSTAHQIYILGPSCGLLGSKPGRTIPGHVTGGLYYTRIDYDFPSANKTIFMNITLYSRAFPLPIDPEQRDTDPLNHPFIERQTDRRYCNRIHDKCIRYVNM